MRKRSRPGSRIGLKVMIGMPRRLACCSVLRKRGLFVPVFWREEKDTLGLVEILQNDGADRYADGLRQGHRRAFVTHVGAVREVVAADDAAEQLIHVGGFQRCMAAHVEHDRFRIAAPQFSTDHAERLLPGHRKVPVRSGVPFQRVRQTAEVFEFMVGPGFEPAHPVGGKELERYLLAGQFPPRGLAAALADFDRLWFFRLGATRRPTQANPPGLFCLKNA